MISYLLLKTAQVDDLLLVANESHLIGIYFLDCDHVPRDQGWRLDPTHSVLQHAATELTEYLAGERTEFTIPLQAAGTDFQRAVWREISSLQFGETITYSELARRAGSVNAVRAAGTATGRNPIAIVVPCHRVMGKHGALGGFAGGLHRKRSLLNVEKIPYLVQ